MPSLTVLAGPNGSGKSSTTRYLQFEGRDNLLDPDAIARRMDFEDPSRAAVKAGREVIRRIREYLDSGQSFGIETTLSGGGHIENMRTARERGFTVHLAYICLDSAEVNIQRVRARFATGGHDVPEEDIRRRYERSLANVPLALRISNTAWLYDNSGDASRAVMGTRDGVVIWCADDAPDWVLRVRGNL